MDRGSSSDLATRCRDLVRRYAVYFKVECRVCVLYFIPENELTGEARAASNHVHALGRAPYASLYLLWAIVSVSTI